MLNALQGRAHRALILAAAMAVAPLASAVSFSNVYSFGDSLSDTGNISFVTGFPQSPYTPGRFTSNFQDGTAGRVWVEYVSEHFGGSSVNSLSGGTNYAWGGARTGPDNAGLPPSLLDQHNFFLDDVDGAADPDALYTVFGGGNDVRDADTGSSVANVTSIISNLADAGARYFVVPTLPNIGLTPEALAGEAPGGSSEELSAITQTFNSDLAAALDDLEATRDITIVRFDIFSLFSDVINDPAAFGLENVNEACFGGNLGVGGDGSLCADVDSYLFFDGIHPTAAGHAIVGAYAIDAIEAALVPLPAALPMFLAALGALGVARRRA
ncbi:MAG: SGNH/GDSL hydrolase family protein [Gammaproteobacteria bacterium]